MSCLRVLLLTLGVLGVLGSTAQATPVALDVWPSSAVLPEPVLLTDTSRVPEEIAAFMRQYFRYEPQPIRPGHDGYWQTPEEILQTRRGDANAFAWFAAEHLVRDGYIAFILQVTSDAATSTVCVFERAGRYDVIQDGQVMSYQADSLARLATAIDQDWIFYGILQPRIDHGAHYVLTQLRDTLP